MIGSRLKLARKGTGLSLRQLSAKMPEEHRVTAMAISKYERDLNTPSSGVLIALADALNVQVSWLVRESTIKLDSFRITHVCKIPEWVG